HQVINSLNGFENKAKGTISIFCICSVRTGELDPSTPCSDPRDGEKRAMWLEINLAKIMRLMSSLLGIWTGHLWELSSTR
ncbi:MAG: hypothetical protein ABR985_11695, partial [Methanotrichaceae archaeon]